MGTAKYESPRIKKGQEQFALILNGAATGHELGFSQINICSVMNPAKIVREVRKRNEIPQDK
jgi:hypothetical protein